MTLSNELTQSEFNEEQAKAWSAASGAAGLRQAASRLSDGRVAVRRNAALVLALSGTIEGLALARLMVARKDSDAAVRRHVVRAFSERAVDLEVAVDVLYGSLDDDDDAVSELAIEGLRQRLRGAPSTLYRHVVGRFKDASMVTQLSMTRVFTELDQTSHMALVGALVHPTGDVRRWARTTLRAIGEAAHPTLVQALKRDKLRQPVLRVLRGQTELGPEIGEALEMLAQVGDDEDTCREARQLLKFLRKEAERTAERPVAVPHAEFASRRLSAKSLKPLVTEEMTAAALRWNLRDGRPAVRANSLTMMAIIGAPRSDAITLRESLLPLVHDTSEDVRQVLAAAAPRLLGSRAVDVLIPLCLDDESAVMMVAQSALTKLAPAAPKALMDRLKSAESPEALAVTVQAVAAAGEATLPAVRALLRNALKPDHRIAAIAVLGAGGTLAKVDREALERALNDEDERVRSVAAQTLGALVRDDRGVARALRRRANIESLPSVRHAASRAADRIVGKGPSLTVKPEVALPLPQFGSEWLSMRSLKENLAKIGPDALRPLYGDGRDRVRHNVALALTLAEKLGDDDISWLLLSLKDEQVRVRGAAARTLGHHRAAPLRAVPGMAHLLSQAAPDQELVVMKAMMAYGRGALGPVLDALTARLVVDPAAVTRVASCIPDPMAAALGKYLHRPADYGVRRLSADLLGAMGERAQVALDDLQTALEDPLGRMKVKACLALGRVAPVSQQSYGLLAACGDYDARASVKGAADAAIVTLASRQQDDVLEEVGGIEGQIGQWQRAR